MVGGVAAAWIAAQQFCAAGADSGTTRLDALSGESGAGMQCVANRIQKVLEDANIKLAPLATDPLGASGRAMLRAIVMGEQEAPKLAEMSRGLLRRKIPVAVGAGGSGDGASSISSQRADGSFGVRGMDEG